MIHLTDRMWPNPLPHVSPGYGWHGHHRPKPKGLYQHLLGKPLPTTHPCVAYEWRYCWLCSCVGSSAHPTLGLDWSNFSHQHWKTPVPGALPFVDRPGFEDWPVRWAVSLQWDPWKLWMRTTNQNWVICQPIADLHNIYTAKASKIKKHHDSYCWSHAWTIMDWIWTDKVV